MPSWRFSLRQGCEYDREFRFMEERVRALVTGGAGFIGSNLAIELASAVHEVVVADDFSSAYWKNLIEFRGEVEATGAAAISHE